MRPDRLARSRGGLVAKVFACWLGLANVLGLAEEAANSQDGACQVWVVNTRSLPHRRCLKREDFAPRVYRRETDAENWTLSDLDTLVEELAGEQITLVMHGNWVASDQAIERGLDFRGKMAKGCRRDRSRYVIWSWPSEEIDERVLTDVEIKACRTNTEGFYLACFLERFPQGRLNLVGYSFGARVVTGGLHVLAGGSLAGLRLDETTATESPDGQSPRSELPTIRAALFAAAVDADWLAPGGKHGLALTQAERVFVTVNPKDRVLKYFPRIPGGDGGPALGYSGLTFQPKSGVSVKQFRVFAAVGRKHSWEDYLDSPQILARLRSELAFGGEPLP